MFIFPLDAYHPIKQTGCLHEKTSTTHCLQPKHESGLQLTQTQKPVFKTNDLIISDCSALAVITHSSSRAGQTTYSDFIPLTDGPCSIIMVKPRTLNTDNNCISYTISISQEAHGPSSNMIAGVGETSFCHLGVVATNDWEHQAPKGVFAKRKRCNTHDSYNQRPTKTSERN